VLDLDPELRFVPAGDVQAGSDVAGAPAAHAV